MPTVDPQYERIQILLRELGQFGQGFEPTKLPMHCEGDDFRAVQNDIEIFTRKVDAVVEAWGEYVKSNAPCSVDLNLFREQLLGSLDGNAFFEISQCAEKADEEALEAEGADDLFMGAS